MYQTQDFLPFSKSYLPTQTYPLSLGAGIKIIQRLILTSSTTGTIFQNFSNLKKVDTLGITQKGYPLLLIFINWRLPFLIKKYFRGKYFLILDMDTHRNYFQKMEMLQSGYLFETKRRKSPFCF